MERFILEHHSDSPFSFPLDGHSLRVRLKAWKGFAPSRVEVLHNCKYRFHEEAFPQEMEEVEEGEECLYFQTTIHQEDPRFAYAFRLYDKDGNVSYFSELGQTERYPLKESFYSFFQMPAVSESDMVKANPRFRGRLFYQVFVDRFARSEAFLNPRTNMEWGDPVTPKSIAGGSLRGIEEKIPYLKSLGVGALYLTPVFESPSNHKYDTTDYLHVAKDFGTDEDLRKLSEKCHEAGILLVLDAVYNHMSDQNPLFQDVLLRGRESQYSDFFRYEGDLPRKGHYETFSFCEYMPRTNLDSKKTRDWFVRYACSLVDRFDIDGLRLDVADEIPHRFYRELRLALEEKKEDFLLIGENWHEASSYLDKGDELDGVMNYPLTKAFLDLERDRETDASGFVKRLVDLKMRYKDGTNRNLLNLLGSHDTHRFLTEVKGNAGRFLGSYALLLFLEGLPCLYYGDEMGLEGGYDPDSRRCFPWREEDQNPEIREGMRKILSIRKEYLDVLSPETIEERDGLILLRRGKVLLILSASPLPRPIHEGVRLLYSHGLKGNTLSPDGLLIALQEDFQ